MLLSKAITAFLDAKYGVTAPSNLRWYKPRLASLLRALGDVDVSAITTADLRRWRRSLIDKKQRWDNHPHRPTEQGGLSPNTIRGYIRACRAFFNWLAGEGIITGQSPALRLEQVPKPRAAPKDISQEDALRIVEAAERGGNVRDYALLCFLADTGCRVGGIGVTPGDPGSGLRLKNVWLQPDEKGRYRALVREKGKGGQQKWRYVYFSQGTASALVVYLSERPRIDDDHVFLGQRRGRPAPLGTEGIHAMIGRYAKPLGIEGQWNPHAWRHAFAHGFLKKGGNLAALSQLMGHSGIEVTGDIYLIWADEELAEWHANHSWFGGHVNNGREPSAGEDDGDSAGDRVSPAV